MTQQVHMCLTVVVRSTVTPEQFTSMLGRELPGLPDSWIIKAGPCPEVQSDTWDDVVEAENAADLGD